MSARVSSFEKVKLGDYDYLFFLVAWDDYETTVKEQLDDNAEKFGENIGTAGLIVQAYDKDKWATAKQIVDKDWGELNERIRSEQEPFLLLINTDFATFNPQTNNWGIIWINDYSEDKDSIPQLFFSIQSRIRKGENLFDFFNSLKDKTPTKSIIRNGTGELKDRNFQIGNKAFIDGGTKEYCSRIRTEISNGNTKKAISFLSETKSNYDNDVVMLSSRYENLRVSGIRRTISNNEETIELNKINHSILELISKIEEEK